MKISLFVRTISLALLVPALVSAQMPPKFAMNVAASRNHPTPNTTEDGLVKNRRVDLASW